MWKTRRLRPRPAGSPEASFSARPCSRLPRTSASLGQSAAWAALAGHIGLVFHLGADLAILEVTVGGQPASFVLCPEEERLKVSVDLRAGASVELALSWSGELNDRLVGFYRSTYTATEGESRYPYP